MGGLNPLAVEVAARERARVVWLPTVDAENEAHAHRTPGAKLPAWAKMQDELRARCLPVWARFVRSRGAVRATAGTLAAGTLSIDLYGLRDGLAAHLTPSPQIHG